MNDLLDLVVDGVKVRDTNLNKFKTETALRAWKKRVSAAYLSVSGVTNYSSQHFNVMGEMNTFLAARTQELRDAAEQRKRNTPWRNQDFVVVPQKREERDASMNYEIGKLTAQNLYYQSFQPFTRAEQMTAYEFDTYATFGDEVCDARGIETLYDVFGTQWADRFYARKKDLILQHEIRELEAERREIDNRIAAKKKEMTGL